MRMVYPMNNICNCDLRGNKHPLRDITVSERFDFAILLVSLQNHVFRQPSNHAIHVNRATYALYPGIPAIRGAWLQSLEKN